jgi:hypothetical protein
LNGRYQVLRLEYFQALDEAKTLGTRINQTQAVTLAALQVNISIALKYIALK